jgi:predicted enzyme related to lactoylglutathione lyase
MPLMESYAPGTFCWADLGTPDARAAKRFYTSLFGWTPEDRPMGPDASYTMLTLDGHAVAALYQQDPVQQGGPGHWLSYISVEAADDAARRARELGATVLMDAFDVLDVGRVALVQDPTGAVVALWEPRQHAGAGVVGEPNSICWNELGTTDPARARAFYTGLFGWAAESPAGSGSYVMFTSRGTPRGGMTEIAPSWGPVPPHWLVYFAVSDCDGRTALAQSLGGGVRVPPSDVSGVGRFAVLADPQGAVFAVMELLPTWRQATG